MEIFTLFVSTMSYASIFVFGEANIRGNSWRLQQHLVTELNLFNILETQTYQSVTHLQFVESQLSHIPLIGDRKDHLGNPLMVLVMIRRLARDWQHLMTQVGWKIPLANFGLEKTRWPTALEVALAAKGVARVQTAYNLLTDELADGELRGNPIAANFTAEDSLNVAVQYYNLGLYSEAAEWLQQTIGIINSGDDSVSRSEVLYYLAATMCFLGYTKASQSVLLSLIAEFPSSRPPETLENDYSSMSTLNCMNLDFENERNHKSSWGKDKEYLQTLHQLCRGEVDRQLDGLRCRYVDYNQPHLRLQPFKLEELQLDPPVLLFHNVITDVEAEALKEDAMSEIEEATTVTNNGKHYKSEYRTSHVAWLDPGVSKVGDILTQRVADITQLSMDYAEDNQLSRYGIAGEFLPHTDNFGEIVPFENDRLATLMFYLNEVEQGGHTVFLDWGLSIPPEKNSAVLWFHYFPSGETDFSSLHSGCPVLQGSKWVLNKWIQNGGNEFRFPCGLSKNASYSKYYM